MKSSNTSERLKRLMKDRNLRQIDVLNMAKPFCDEHNVKLGKNDLSQYVSGKVEPGQEKLAILGNTLGVSEAWLMGYDVPMERSEPQVNSPTPSEPQKRETEDLNDSFAILSRKAKKLTPEQRDKLLEMASLMFEEEFRD